MIGVALDVAFYTAHFILGKTYDGVYRLVWGKPKNPIVEKLNELEQKLLEMNHKTENDIFYLTIRGKYPPGRWLVIQNREVVFETHEKILAVEWTIQKLKSTKSEILVIQVGDEFKKLNF